MLATAFATSITGFVLPSATGKHSTYAASSARSHVDLFFLSDEKRQRNVASILEDDGACHLLSESQRAAIHEMIASDSIPSDREAVLDNLFVECDEPSDDPNMTCFLTPESWIEGGTDQLHSSKYLCMTNPDPTRQPLSMNPEDSY